MHTQLATLPEAWLRGAVADIPPLLQPVAHSLIQAVEDVDMIMEDFPADCLWLQPGGVAAVGFHLQHLTGVLDRMLTYSKNHSLQEHQLEAIHLEGMPSLTKQSYKELVADFHVGAEKFILELRRIDERSFSEPRFVGRLALPSTVFGILMHAAEHTQRHIGQLLVTTRILKSMIS